MNTYLAQKFNRKITMKQLFNPKIYLMVMFFCMTLTSNAVTKTNPKTKFGTFTTSVENHTSINFYLSHFWYKTRHDIKLQQDFLYSFANSSTAYFYTFTQPLQVEPKYSRHRLIMCDTMTFDENDRRGVKLCNIYIYAHQDLDIDYYYYDKDITNVSEDTIKKNILHDPSECNVTRNITNLDIVTTHDILINYVTESNGDKRANVTVLCKIFQKGLDITDELLTNVNIEMKDMIFSKLDILRGYYP